MNTAIFTGFGGRRQDKFLMARQLPTRVSIDQVVLSAKRYLVTRLGTARNDRTILPATPPY
jgi:hypothetical protein